MSYKNKTLKIYLAGKMSGLSFDEMNNWRKDTKDKLLIISQIADYQLQIINPVDYYNFEKSVINQKQRWKIMI